MALVVFFLGLIIAKSINPVIAEGNINYLVSALIIASLTDVGKLYFTLKSYLKELQFKDEFLEILKQKKNEIK